MKQTIVSHLVTVFCTALALAGCSKKQAPDQAAPDPASSTTTEHSTGDPVTKAKLVFSTRCVPCHGSTGHGDGPASASLNPKPRQYADPAWQVSVDDAYLEKIIKYGGAAVGKSPAMPTNPDLDPATITALKDIVRSFNPKK